MYISRIEQNHDILHFPGRYLVRTFTIERTIQLLIDIDACGIRTCSFLVIRDIWSVAIVVLTLSYIRSSQGVYEPAAILAYSCFFPGVQRFVERTVVSRRAVPIKGRFVISSIAAWGIAAHWAAASRENNDPTPPGSFRGPFVVP